MSSPLPNQSTDGVDRAHALPQAVEVPAPPQHPVDAAPVLTPELLDREAAADMAGSIVADIFTQLLRRRPKVIDVESVACALLPLAALPPVWQVVTVGIVASVFVGDCLLLLFLPAGRRSREFSQVPGRIGSEEGDPANRVPRCFVAEPARDFSIEADSSRRSLGRLDRTTGELGVLTPVVRVFNPGVSDE